MILFAGDSFSADDGQNTWTNIFANNLGKKFVNASIKGSSIWYAYKSILKNSKNILENNIEYTIITCTSPYRIPYHKDPHLCAVSGNYESYTSNFNEITTDMFHFWYYQNLFDLDLHNFLFKKCLSDIIYQLKNHTKIILLPCFSDSLFLINEIYKELPNFSYINFPLTDICVLDNTPIFKNHFTIKTNLVFGKLLSEKIIQTNYGLLNFTSKEIKEALK